jgi:hypothetical protein
MWKLKLSTSITEISHKFGTQHKIKYNSSSSGGFDGGGCGSSKEATNPINSSNKPEYVRVTGREVMDLLRLVIESARETDGCLILILNYK